MSPKTSPTAAAGFSVTELLLVAAVAVATMAMAVPALTVGTNDHRTTAAGWHLVARMRAARMEAVRRGRTMALRFETRAGDVSYRLYADGNRNGVRAADISAGVDRAIGPGERLGDGFPGVTFARDPSTPPIGGAGDAGSSTDPIRFGASDIASFTPSGTATAGTAYLAGRGPAQCAVRVLGVTGRVRLLCYRPADGQWTAP